MSSVSNTRADRLISHDFPARRTVGVVGGMGPAATSAFFARLIARTSAARDQDHLHVVIDSDPTTPDRTAYLLGQGESPLPHLLSAVHRLEVAGCDLLVMPCNTATIFAAELESATKVPMLNWVDTAAEAAAAVAQQRIGLLATTGTVTSGLYQAALAKLGRLTLTPSDAAQSAVMAAVYGPHGIKAGEHSETARASLLAAAAELAADGAEMLLLGCTEIPLILGADSEAWPVPALDPADVMACRVVKEAGAELKATPSIRPE